MFKIVKYYRPNCVPCRIMSNTLEEFINKHDNFSIEEINVNDLSDEEYKKEKIKTVPTIKLKSEDGEELATFLGSAQLNSFSLWISRQIDTQKS